MRLPEFQPWLGDPWKGEVENIPSLHGEVIGVAKKGLIILIRRDDGKEFIVHRSSFTPAPKTEKVALGPFITESKEVSVPKASTPKPLLLNMLQSFK